MSDEWIDLRSDTVTRPSPAMRRAMAGADVGDDVYEEDPTVRALEERVAALLGFESALFVPSGTMGNQLSLHLLGRPGREVIGEASCHVFTFEMAALSAISGMMPRPLATSDGLLTADLVEAAIAPDLTWRAPTGLIALENTHNMAGGRVLPLDRVAAIQEVARRHRLPIHLDGARLWNAAAALGVLPAAVGAGFDTVMVCLSKGLGAPAGSLVALPAARLREARKIRKMLGGGMRQVGILAAAGLVALDEELPRIAEDHVVAAGIGDGIAAVPGITLVAPPETNILIFEVGAEWFAPGKPPADPAPRFAAKLREKGILVSPFGPTRVRVVTHRDLPAGAVDWVVEAVATRGA
jgi:threonine aldolase